MMEEWRQLAADLERVVNVLVVIGLVFLAGWGLLAASVLFRF